MKISTEIYSAAKHIGEEKAVEYIARAGFEAWDFSMFDMFSYDRQTKELIVHDHPLCGPDYLAYARRLRQIGLDNGIRCNQSHAPFPTVGEKAYSHLKRALECTAEAGGEICIIHPAYGSDFTGEQNAEVYADLLPFAKDCGVKIATENMWNWIGEQNEAAPAACSDPTSFKAHLDALADDCLVACLDIGHAEMKGLNTSAVDMIRALGGKLQALHIHDNDKRHDSHQLPGAMQIAFDPIVRALKEIGYTGYFTLEADAYLRAYTAETVLDGLKLMAAAARKLAELYDSL